MSKPKGERNNQLTNPADYDVKRMVFSEPQVNTVKDSTIVYRRINISTLNKDGSVGDLILPTERLFSFGVSESKSQETKMVNGHTLPLCLWDREKPTTAQKMWTDTFNRIVEQCKKHILDNREEVEQFDLTEAELKKFNPLYWKRDKGKIVEGTGPTLYAKLISSKKHNKVLSMFFDTNGETIDPMSLLGKYCYANAAIKIESIFVGNKISLQVKLYEATVELMDNMMKPLMARPKSSGRMLTGNSTTMNEMNEEEDDTKPKPPNPVDESGSIHGSDDEEATRKVVPTTVVRKVVRKVQKK